MHNIHAQLTVILFLKKEFFFSIFAFVTKLELRLLSETF